MKIKINSSIATSTDFLQQNELYAQIEENYMRLKIVPGDHMPDFMIYMFEERKPLISFVADFGILIWISLQPNYWQDTNIYISHVER